MWGTFFARLPYFCPLLVVSGDACTLYFAKVMDKHHSSMGRALAMLKNSQKCFVDYQIKEIYWMVAFATMPMFYEKFLGWPNTSTVLLFIKKLA